MKENENNLLGIFGDIAIFYFSLYHNIFINIVGLINKVFSKSPNKNASNSNDLFIGTDNLTYIQYELRCISPHDTKEAAYKAIV